MQSRFDGFDFFATLVITMKLSRPVGVFVVVVLVELEVIVVVWGDVRMQLTMRDWDGSMQ